MKILTYVLIIVLLSSYSFAIEDASFLSYRVNEQANLKIRVSNQTDVVTDATCLIDIYYPNNTVAVNDGVMEYSARRYNYTYTFTETGEWFAEYFCNNSAETVVYGEDVSIQETDIVNTTYKLNQILSNQTVIKTNLSTIRANITTNQNYLEDINKDVRSNNFLLSYFIPEWIWKYFTPREITDGNGNVINKTSITARVWDYDYREVHNVRGGPD